ncbi:sensor domain-containing phosphodiesterase [Martelella endophytica]|uniref:sensor domain-containing phosphodiesterase n=1 Tax=Martelella endophytica TaxID=1486262 RepID=UPI0005F0E5E4|nr:EAL domain-containing protein [Martelella endophytica]
MRRPLLDFDTSAPRQDGDTLDIILETVRTHLDMDVAYVSEIIGDDAVFRAASAPGREALVGPGKTMDLRQVYCRRIIDGALPRLMADTSKHPLAVALPITSAVPIGCHMSVPLLREDGSVYGMFCCLGTKPNPSLGQRDLEVMETFANLASRQINEGIQRRKEIAAAEERIEAALREDGFHMVLQPIVSLATGTPIKFEALSRFNGLPQRPPNLWYDEAHRIGRQVELEIASIENALRLLERLPADMSIGVNASPATIATGALTEVVRRSEPKRIIVEITEHAVVEDHDSLAAELSNLRRLGVKTAVDDVGAGFSGLVALLKMQPDILKLDVELIRDIDTNPAKQALVLGMVHFAEQTGAITIAEGVETEAERETLKSLRVVNGQGYLFGRPMAIAAALEWLAANRDPAARAT